MDIRRLIQRVDVLACDVGAIEFCYGHCISPELVLDTARSIYRVDVNAGTEFQAGSHVFAKQRLRMLAIRFGKGRSAVVCGPD
jgi:hypothetical protein